MKLMLGSLALLGGTVFGVSQTSANSYTVQSGDTLNKLAAENNTTVEKIALENDIKNIHLIFTGQELEINPVLAQTKETVIESPVNQEEVMQPIISAPVVERPQVQPEPQANSGDVHSQFIANGGTEVMWNTIVLPESGGNPDITSPNGYHGLGQTKEAWGYGSVETQTAGMIDYANSRYGSVENAISFRLANNWW